MKLTGKVIRYGDHVDTDAIIAARYMNTADPAVMAAHAMADYDADFHAKLAQGRTIIVAGVNFGCGSSREHAPIALQAAGIRCVIAPSFARIFYRNAINIGLPILESAEASRAIADGAEVSVDLDAGTIDCPDAGGCWAIPGGSGFIAEILSAGGLVALVRRRLEEKA